MTNWRRYVIAGEPASGKNHMRRVWAPKKRRYVFVRSAAAEAWILDATAQLVRQRGRTPTLNVPVRVTCDVYQKSLTRDLDNVISAVSDSLQKAGVLTDDYLIAEWNARKRIDAELPRVELTVIPVEE